MASNLVSRVRNLQQRKGRKRTGLTVAEGVRLVEDALAAGVSIRGAVVSKDLAATDRGARLLGSLASRAVPLQEVDDRLLDELADTDTPQGVIAVVEPPRHELSQIGAGTRAAVLVLDGVQDPGNVGALLRTGFALGAAGAIVLPGTGDVTNPKVIRAAMGATFRFPIAHASVKELTHWARGREVSLWITDIQGTPIDAVDRTEQRVAVIFGNEGAGVRPEVLLVADRRICIPMAPGAESLNVVVAAGIILYEVHRAG